MLNSRQQVESLALSLGSRGALTLQDGEARRMATCELGISTPERHLEAGWESESQSQLEATGFVCASASFSLAPQACGSKIN